MIKLRMKKGYIYPLRKGSESIICVTLVLFFFLVSSSLSYASAATAWDSALEEINALHNNYTSLQDSLKTDSLKILTLRKVNNDDLRSINQIGRAHV